MIQLTLPPLDVDDTHLESWYQIATDREFNDIKISNKRDSDNLLKYDYDRNILIDKEYYYARTRYATAKKGLSYWSEPFYFYFTLFVPILNGCNVRCVSVNEVYLTADMEYRIVTETSVDTTTGSIEEVFDRAEMV